MSGIIKEIFSKNILETFHKILYWNKWRPYDEWASFEMENVMRERETYFGLSHRNDQVWKKENKFVGCKNGWEQDRLTKQAERTRNSIHHVEKVQANSIEIPK